MKELKPRIHENGMDYVLVGDYYVPDLKLPEERRPIGHWGRLHQSYLKLHRPMLYNELILSGRLHTVVAAGHEIGLHGYSHTCMADMSMEKLEQELCRTEALLQEQTGTTTCLLRPPGGKRCQTVTQGAAAHGLSLITWSVDPKDWATNDRDKVVQRVLDRVCDGDIILMHDMSDSSVDAALAIIDRLEEAGYRFVTVSELADLRGKTMEAGCLYTSFHPTFTVDAN